MGKISCFIHVQVSDSFVLQPTQVTMLTVIYNTGSLLQTAKQLNISYQHAWNTVTHINRVAPLPVVELRRGGQKGGGAAITQYGAQILKDYTVIQIIIQKTVNQIETEMAM
ncbi:MAG TPA: hypothetical protein PK029_07305 [Bacteroidales bacterium]|nr:MAG: Molybdenum-pterin-binding protein MopA [Bacteroidetes bacterium ADurb.Bin217]HPH16961.1 hypothetical protein [Bacteroidales bacterium]HPM13337.1 hypothetical protein [Bacteroidales bacterium]